MEDICETEVLCIKSLDFKLNYFTSYHFVEMFLNMGIVTEDELEATITRISGAKFEDFINYESENSSNSYQSQKHCLIVLDKLYKSCMEMLGQAVESNS